VKRQRTIEWQVCGVCNYDCSYCIQSKKHRVGQPSIEEVERFLDFFVSLDGAPWEIKVTGGEPFAFKAFVDRIVPCLVARTPHTLSVLTNLSAPVSVLERFANAVRGRLGVLSASLHLEFTSAQKFVPKLVRLRELLGEDARIVVK
jgi:molybdenum cofactor biosynthesis enzyme MoaA